MRFKFIAQRLRAYLPPVLLAAALIWLVADAFLPEQSALLPVTVAQPVRRLPGASGARQLTPFGCLAAFWLPSFFGAQLRKALPCS